MLHNNGIKVTIWSHDNDNVIELNKRKKEIIKGHKIPKKIEFTSSLENALENAEIVFIMVAAKYVGEVAFKIKKKVTYLQVTSLI